MSEQISEIPHNYVEFVEQFHERIRNQIVGFKGIDNNEVEDITQTVIMQFIAGDYLNIYSPQKQNRFAEIRYQDQLSRFQSGELVCEPIRYTGKFSSFVFEFVKRRLMGIRDRAIKRDRLMRSLDTFFEFEQNDDSCDSSLLIFFGIPDAEFLNIEVRQLLQLAYVHLCAITSPTETRNFPELFQQTIEDAFNLPDGFDREIYASRKGITVSAVSMQLREMRTCLEQCGLYRDICFLMIQRNKTLHHVAT